MANRRINELPTEIVNETDLHLIADPTTGAVSNVTHAKLLTKSIRVFENLAALKAIRPDTGTLAATVSYAVAGDEGGGYYQYDGSSTATDDGGIILLPTVGSGAGRWKQIARDGWINAKTFGVVADGTTNDLPALQAAERACSAAHYNLKLPRGKIRINGEWQIGIPSSDPNFNQTTFFVKGEGVGADSNAPVFPGASGTAIRIYGTGHRSVVCFEESNWRYGGISNLTVECDTAGGAEHGLLFADTRMSQFFVHFVHSNKATRAFSVLKGNGNNGEFLDYSNCAGSAVTNFFYMNNGSGQSYNHVFYNCRGGVDAGGSLFEVGGTDPGYGLSTYGFNSTSIGAGSQVDAVFNTAADTTFFKNNGANGTFEFNGGRNEHLSKITHHVNASFFYTSQTHFKDVAFDGMISTSIRKMFTSTGSNNNSTVRMTGCNLFGFGGQATKFDFGLAIQESMKYEFEHCKFRFDLYATQLGRDDRIAFQDCERIYLNEKTVRFTNIIDKLATKLPPLGVYNNLLREPAFTAGFTTLPAPWVLGAGEVFAIRGPEDSNVASVPEKEPFFRELVMSTGAEIYQDIPEFDLSGGVPMTAYYKARVGGRSDSADSVTISLENSNTGKVYDSFTFVPSVGYQNILLIAHEYSNSGFLRVKIRANVGVPTFSIQTQLVSADINASYYKEEITPLAVDDKIVYFGDSLTDDGISDSGTTNQFTSYGFTTWAQIYAGSPFLMPVGGNKGIGGQSTTQMLTRLGAAVALKPKIVTVLAGTNDLGAFETAANIMANLEKIYNAFLAAGAIVVPICIFPRADLGGSQETDRTTINNWIMGKRNQKNMYPVNINHLLTSPGTVYRDGIHLNSIGGSIAGNVVANVFRLFAPAKSVRDLIFTDQVVGTTTLLAGTGGTLSGGATGVAPTGWELYGSGTAGTTVVGSKDSNDVFTLTVGGTYTGNDKSTAVGQYGSSTPFAVNDLVEGIIDVEIVSKNAAISNIKFDIGLNGVGGSIAANSAMVRTDDHPLQLAPGRYIMRTPVSRLTEAANFTSMLMYVEFVNTVTTDAISAVIKVHRLAIRKIN